MSTHGRGRHKLPQSHRAGYRPNYFPTNITINNHRSRVNVSVSTPPQYSSRSPSPYSSKSPHVKNKRDAKGREGRPDRECQKKKPERNGVREGFSRSKSDTGRNPSSAILHGRSSDPHQGRSNERGAYSGRHSSPCQDRNYSGHCNQSRQESGECTSGNSARVFASGVLPLPDFGPLKAKYEGDVLYIDPTRPKDEKSKKSWEDAISSCYDL